MGISRTYENVNDCGPVTFQIWDWKVLNFSHIVPKSQLDDRMVEGIFFKFDLFGFVEWTALMFQRCHGSVGELGEIVG